MIQCAPDISRSIFSKSLTKDTHSSPHRTSYGCLSWISSLIEVLPPNLLCCVQYRIILYRDISRVYIAKDVDASLPCLHKPSFCDNGPTRPNLWFNFPRNSDIVITIVWLPAVTFKKCDQVCHIICMLSTTLHEHSVPTHNSLNVSQVGKYHYSALLYM